MKLRGKERHSNPQVGISWLDTSYSRYNDYCKFAQQGYAVIRRDGKVSPCLSLLHDHPIYLYGRRKRVTRHAFGNINQQSLGEIWESAAFLAFRRQLQDFRAQGLVQCP